MTTQELIKQAEELLSKCSDGPWEIKYERKAPIPFFYCYSNNYAPNHAGIVLRREAFSLVAWTGMFDINLIKFSRNHLPEIIENLKKYRESLEYIARADLSARHCEEVAKKALEE